MCFALNDPRVIVMFGLHCFKFVLKAGFHMIADDRRRSQRELFPYNRRQSQTIAEPTVAYISVSESVRKIAANNMADVEEETLLQAKL